MSRDLAGLAPSVNDRIWAERRGVAAHAAGGADVISIFDFRFSILASNAIEDPANMRLGRIITARVREISGHDFHPAVLERPAGRNP